MTRISLGGERIADIEDAGSVHRICQEPQRTWEKWWQAGSERLNPIFVKEVRQSLKSRQFEISFGLTMLAAIGWTFIFIASSVPGLYFIPGGIPLLIGYAVILLVPLLIVIPFSAFRSLTTEIEESTYELLSISSLSAKQIVTGKMATAALQILLYVSALAPCIMLTYMLRGVSLMSIALLLGIAVAYSVMLVSCGLLVATVSRTRSGQSGMSVLLLIVLVISFFSAMASIVEGDIITSVVSSSPPREFLIVIFAAVTILAAVFSLLMQAAAAAIDFPSENKSTPIRKRLLAVIAVLLFWLVLGLMVEEVSHPRGLSEVLQFFLGGFFVVWMAIGGLVCGERGIISPRARRTLPRTFAGRVMLTWLSPGAGLGYVFLVTVFASVALLFIGLEMFAARGTSNVQPLEQLFLFACVLTCYYAFYVGLCRLIMLALGRRIAAPMLVSFALLAVLLLALQLVPYFLAVYWNDFSTVSYAWHQTFNIVMTVDAVMGGSWPTFLGNLIALALAAIAVFGLNLMLSTKDVMILRLTAPARVQREKNPEPPVSVNVVADPFQ
ncbi:MAG: ABC transporter permease [Aureliella sp.]